jgi:hypothetical protein
LANKIEHTTREEQQKKENKQLKELQRPRRECTRKKKLNSRIEEDNAGPVNRIGGVKFPLEPRCAKMEEKRRENPGIPSPHGHGR